MGPRCLCPCSGLPPPPTHACPPVAPAALSLYLGGSSHLLENFQKRHPSPCGERASGLHRLRRHGKAPRWSLQIHPRPSSWDRALGPGTVLTRTASSESDFKESAPWAQIPVLSPRYVCDHGEGSVPLNVSISSVISQIFMSQPLGTGV